MAKKIEDIHERLFKILDTHYQNNKDFRFTLRVNNIDGKLEDGYWFLGDENEVIVSFWNGINIQTGLPDIYLSLDLSERLSLKVQIEPNRKKAQFLEKFILSLFSANSLNSISTPEEHIFLTDPNIELITLIDSFIKGPKLAIDEYIEGLGEEYSNEELRRGEFGFIPKKLFQINYKNVQGYRSEILQEKEFQLFSSNNQERPSYIKSCSIRNFHALKHAKIKDLDFGNKWIFLAGENGSGKTLFLKALAICLSKNVIPVALRSFDQAPEFKFEFYVNKSKSKEYIRNGNAFDEIHERRPLTKGFAAYGVFRQSIETKLYKTTYSALSKKGSLDSMMKPATPLIDFIRTLKDWGRNEREYEIFQKRQNYLVNILVKVVPGVRDIHFDRDSNEVRADFFVQFHNEPMKKLRFQELPSGTKGVLSLVADIVIRFYKQQPEIYDPSQFQGIVLIDEIDLHLHPKAQKELVKNLASIFPGIQFIVSTHSPIPFLGAPKNSVIYKVSHEGNNSLKRMDDKIMFSELLPNSFLTSPIFGMESIINENSDSYRTEDSYKDIELNDVINKRSLDFLTHKKEEELINLIRKKRDERNN